MARWIAKDLYFLLGPLGRVVWAPGNIVIRGRAATATRSVVRFQNALNPNRFIRRQNLVKDDQKF